LELLWAVALLCVGVYTDNNWIEAIVGAVAIGLGFVAGVGYALAEPEFPYGHHA
jgi:hypothetical protein